MALSTAERNRRKRDRKKKEKEERRKADEEVKNDRNEHEDQQHDVDEIEIEYVAEPLLVSDSFSTKPPPPSNDPALPEGLPPMNGEAEQPEHEAEDIGAVVRRFHQRSAVVTVVTDDERKADGEGARAGSDDEDDDDDDDEDDRKPMSKRKLRDLLRPDIADLKRRVKRPDLVEAHDITAADPDFLIHLKAIPGTVPVPRHWGRKRKYLQGKRGFEKPPFQASL
jgi:splicing factor 3B subunit 2